MRITYRGGVKPGDGLMVGGWAVLVSDDGGLEVFGGILPSHKAAEDYARAAYRGRNWRLLPCDGHVVSHLTAIDQSGCITAVIM